MHGKDDLQGHIALVTGASRGIGQAVLESLGRAGATVIGTATSEQGAEGIRQRLSEAGLMGTGMALDVTDSEQIAEVLGAIGRDFGAPTILVNNAGITRDNLLMRMKDDEWDQIIDTNLSSVYRMSKACLRGMMKARGGRIINIGSVVGAMGNAGQANYSAAKAGIMGLTKSMARELGARNITVNTVAPGFIETDMTAAMSEEQRAALIGNVPLERLGSPEDIAAAVTFLASPSAGYITGETLHVNGGMHMA
ncbi:3-oxoacyl-ACP reductase FabG [Halorhodospira sp. 9621]|uniref:3-oxoacyl-ACP reductase FabG n=1 Tax=Halorhodospira TaxID=85108 RepID=UPI0019138BA0|nr:3-oxoacyl-ACP reductase [Halorhodospira halophila]MCG5528097.1 3-oxoacyl-ACP reductase FabG [Halorhodospira halophila]MCG5531866.1 3-oxoacyl-ACP reductase FabG [Halorhodospira sp. 9621]MCG5537514.1 3-oxoacyl-ACP reductase FabG [Halorhodospira sp. 9622]MCG5543031.1 3-oxoacyl-ACP reductase FabG [Halorhodospira sp. 9628]